MNIFALDYSPMIAARMHCDVHVVKMSVETAQIISTVFHRYGMDIGYKPTHQNHPCTKWAGDTRGNFLWTAQLLAHLLQEYDRRYGGEGKMVRPREIAWAAAQFATVIPAGPPTPFALAMPDIYKSDDAVESYRRYYIHEKAKIAKWNHSPTPEWFASHVPSE